MRIYRWGIFDEAYLFFSTKHRSTSFQIMQSGSEGSLCRAYATGRASQGPLVCHRGPRRCFQVGGRQERRTLGGSGPRGHKPGHDKVTWVRERKVQEPEKHQMIDSIARLYMFEVYHFCLPQKNNLIMSNRRYQDVSVPCERRPPPPLLYMNVLLMCETGTPTVSALMTTMRPVVGVIKLMATISSFTGAQPPSVCAAQVRFIVSWLETNGCSPRATRARAAHWAAGPSTSSELLAEAKERDNRAKTTALGSVWCITHPSSAQQLLRQSGCLNAMCCHSASDEALSGCWSVGVMHLTGLYCLSSVLHQVWPLDGSKTSSFFYWYYTSLSCGQRHEAIKNTHINIIAIWIKYYFLKLHFESLTFKMLYSCHRSMSPWWHQLCVSGTGT